MRKPNRIKSKHNHHSPITKVPNLFCLSTVHIAKESLPISEYFIKYYKNLGVNKFYLSLNGSKDDEKKFKKFLKENDVNYESILWEEKFTCRKKSKYAQRLYKKIIEENNQNDWLFTVDTDEIYSIQKYKSWNEYYNLSDIRYYDYIITFFADMIHSIENPIIDVKSGDNLIKLFRIPTLFTQEVSKRCIKKICLSKIKVIRDKKHAYHRITHSSANKYKPYPKILPLMHFTLTAQAVNLMTYKMNIDKINERFSTQVKMQYDFIKNKSSFSKLVINDYVDVVCYNIYKGHSYKLNVFRGDNDIKYNSNRDLYSKIKIGDYLPYCL